MFPFIRQIVAEAVSNAGYPALYLNPVNFEQLYIQQRQAEQAAQKLDKTKAAGEA